MNKEWNIVVDNQPYHIELAKKGKVIINREELRLKDCGKKSGRAYTEYELRLGSKQAFLVIMSMSGAQLIVDNRDCETGEEYVPPEMPGWATIFVILDICLFTLGLRGIVVGGAIGGAIIGVGMVLTMSISCNRKKSTLERVLLDIAVLIGLFAVLYAVKILLALLFFGF